jgi:hypothetical protein
MRSKSAGVIPCLWAIPNSLTNGTFYNFSARLYGLSSINHGSRCKGLYLNKIAGPDEFLNVSLRVRSKLRNQVFESRTIRQDGPVRAQRSPPLRILEILL